jgi:dTDP-4-dehydrorhamnose reductase
MSIKDKQTIILGSNGYIGSYLLKRFIDEDKLTFGLARNTKRSFDLLDSATWKFKSNIKYAVVASAVTSVLHCENKPQDTCFINVTQSLKLTKYLISLGIIPIVFSSDYVFDGINGNYFENSITNPINEYGKQKALLEDILLNHYHDKCVILRLSKVYGNEECKKTFINELIGNFENENIINAAIDQIFCPIHLEDIFKVICQIQNQKLKGLFNLCGPKAYQRYCLAEMIADEFKFNKNLIKKISLKDLGEKFKRPFNTSMISKRLNLAKISSIEDNLIKICEYYERKKSVAANC